MTVSTEQNVTGQNVTGQFLSLRNQADSRMEENIFEKYRLAEEIRGQKESVECGENRKC